MSSSLINFCLNKEGPLLFSSLITGLLPYISSFLFSHLQMVAGMVCVALSFLFACLLQLYITEPLVSCRGGVSILWQIPQLLLVSFAEVLVAVTGLEFAYSQSPSESRLEEK